MRAFIPIAGVALLLFLVAACTSPQPTATPTATATATLIPTEEPGATATPTPDDGMTEGQADLVIALHETNDSGQTGIVVFRAMGNQTEVTVQGALGISTANHIHTGDCMNLGGVKYPLTNLADGMGVSVVEVSLEELTAGGLAVNLHKTGEASVYTACGDIPTKGSYVTIVLGELNGSGQTGIGTLVASGEETEVVLVATPDISEANHIHTGTCMNLGGVAYALTNMDAGVSVTRVAASLDSLLVGGYAVNLHMAGNAGVYTACGDIAQGEDMVSSGGGSTTSNMVEAEVVDYLLPSLNVKPGDTVVWTQKDMEGHTLTAVGLFDSGILLQNQTYSHKFTQAGTYQYVCTLHPDMKGTITVAAAVSDGMGDSYDPY